MAKLIALYKQPADKEAFNRHYFTTHVPLAKALPGLRSYEISDGNITGSKVASGIFLIAVLSFDSMSALQDAMASKEGKATAADLANFTAGVDILMCDTRTV